MHAATIGHVKELNKMGTITHYVTAKYNIGLRCVSKTIILQLVYKIHNGALLVLCVMTEKNATSTTNRAMEISNAQSKCC